MTTKKFLSSLLAVSLVASFASVTSFAATSSAAAQGYVSIDTDLLIVDDDGDTLTNSAGTPYATAISGNNSIMLDALSPNQTFYIPLDVTGGTTAITTLDDGSSSSAAFATADYLVDSDYFKLSVDKDGSGKALIKSITQVSEKNLTGTRSNYLKVVLNDTTTTSELKATAELTFKAKKTVNATTNSSDYTAGQNVYTTGDSAVLNLTMWINNKAVEGSDNTVDTGTGAYYSPTANENNTLIWGDDRAALEFSTDDAASDFYVKLSTKTDAEIYTEYGDPVNADLYFYDFVGNPTVPTTSRAALTLGIPWDEDDDYAPDPASCYIYAEDSDGYLTDVTDQFTYSEDAQEIPGWTTKTRTLGTYIVSDTALDVDAIFDDEPADDTTTTDPAVPVPDKEIPNTGSSDMVNVAVVAGILSLSTAAALSFRKVTRDTGDTEATMDAGDAGK